MRQLQALSILMSGQSVFLTGAPGAGKTYVLNQFIKLATKQGKNVAVTASTGIAATHIGGTTIHSWSGLGIREVLSEWDRDRMRQTDRLVKRYNAVDILVIDEVSMLHGRRLDMVNEACKLLRENDAPFGGLQVVLVGDLFQLPPISRGGEMVDFAHLSAAWRELNPRVCYLSEQHRQASDGLLDLLEAMRRGDVNELHEAMLQERLQHKPLAGHAVTRLYSHNIDVETINDKHLKAIERDAKVFTMRTSGSSAKVEQLAKSILAPAKLELKIGAEVMFVANNFAAGFVNGTRGSVVAFQGDLPIVELLNGREVRVEPHGWTLEEDGKKRAEVTQLPLRLAWAITIHKSQGMSLDAAEIDLSRSFTPGMGYVALSRVRSLDGVYLGGINRMALAMHPQIFDFDAELRNLSQALANITHDYEPPAEAPEPEVDSVLLQKLKDWRLSRATSDEVPAYIIAHNTVLEAIALRPPASLQAFKGVKGFGPKKTATYGQEIMDIITRHQNEAKVS
jgi:ATP-dependent exoDNAse (exonuclease V) alpha subunit